MLLMLKNFLVELGLMNGAVAVGTVHDPCYKTIRDGPYVHGDGGDNKIQYAIVDFPESDITEKTDKFFPDLPRTCMHPHTNGGGEMRKKVLQCSRARASTQVLQGPVHPQESGNDCWACWQAIAIQVSNCTLTNRQ